MAQPYMRMPAELIFSEYHGHCTHTRAYIRAKYLATESLAPKSRPEAIVDKSRPIER